VIVRLHASKFVATGVFLAKISGLLKHSGKCCSPLSEMAAKMQEV